eukprot:gene4168-4578_t
MKDNNEHGKAVFLLGQEVLSSANQGQYRKFCDLVRQSAAEPAFPRLYFWSRALLASLINQHLLISSFLLDHGYPVNHPACPNLLLDYLRQDNDHVDDKCLPIINLLAKYQFDFNRQEESSWFAPLHLVVQYAMPQCVEALLELGVDVNSVAERDQLPLTLAKALPTESPHRNRIIDLLERKGGRESWRRNGQQVAWGGVASTNISVKSSLGLTSFDRTISNNDTSEGNGDGAVPQVGEKKFVKFSSAALFGQSEDDGALLFSTG